MTPAVSSFLHHEGPSWLSIPWSGKMLFTITSLGNWMKGCVVVVVALLECCQSKVKLLTRFPKEGKARIPLEFKTYAMFAPTKGEKIKLVR